MGAMTYPIFLCVLVQSHVTIENWPHKDAWDIISISLTAALVVIGAITWGAMYSSVVATKKSVALQEAALRQWVTIDKIRSRTNPSFATGTSETMLIVSFDVRNPTKMPLTLEWIVARLGGSRNDTALHYVLPPGESYPAEVSTILREPRIENYSRSNLVLDLIVTVGFTDALEKSVKHAVGFTCVYGPSNPPQCRPYSGSLPNDEIAKQPEPS
jgi:hypothetical protein